MTNHTQTRSATTASHRAYLAERKFQKAMEKKWAAEAKKAAK